jgi:hypothetical protein
MTGCSQPCPTTRRARVRFRTFLMTELVMIVGVLPLVLRGARWPGPCEPAERVISS